MLRVCIRGGAGRQRSRSAPFLRTCVTQHRAGCTSAIHQGDSVNMYITNLACVVSLQDGLSGESTHLLMIFIGIAAFALLAQAFVMLGMAIGASKAQKKLLGHVEDISNKLLPLIDK